MIIKKKLLKDATLCLLVIAVALPLLHNVRRALVCDRFIVRGESMGPSFHEGEKVWVNKLLMGARIYKSFDFDSGVLRCFRLPGFRELMVGDAAIFNMPYGQGWGHISFKINYVYLKRCIGCPGDTVSIVDCRYFNSRTGYAVGIPKQASFILRTVSDSVLMEERSLKAGQFAGMGEVWTVREFGPLAIPSRGMVMPLDSAMVKTYSVILEYEQGKVPEPGGEPYTFLHDYYFFAGDNMVNSRDSRFFGLVPDEYIIGVIKSS